MSHLGKVDWKKLKKGEKTQEDIDGQMKKNDLRIAVDTLKARLEEALDEKNATCEKLGQIAGNVAGLSVDCEFTGDSIIETQTLDYESLNNEELTSAYAEAGGTAPEFEKDQDINEVQKKLQSAGYTCTKIK